MEVKTEVKTTNLSPRAQEDYNMVLEAIDGSQKAYTMLMERYRSSIFHMMLKMVNNRDDADDLTLEAFGKAFNKLPSHIRKKRLHLLSIDDPIEPNSDHDFSSNIRSTALDPEEQFIRSQRLSLMRNILGELSLKYRLMIELRFFEELSYDEIAKELDIPLGTVKAQLFRAKEILFQLLQTPRAQAYLDSTRRRSKTKRTSKKKAVVEQEQKAVAHAVTAAMEG